MAVKTGSNQLKIPLQLTSRYDIGRLLRELGSLNDFFTQRNLRHEKHKETVSQSQLMTVVAAENNLDLTDKVQREALADALQEIKESAPVVHVSFAVEPDAIVVQKVLLWFRREIDPLTLLSIGVQPSIAAGCVVRTESDYFDFSLRQHLLRNSELLLERLRSLK